MGSWTRPTCKCCISKAVQPLVALELIEDINMETKRWLMTRIQAEKIVGGAELMVHPGEDDDGNMLLVSASQHVLLRAAEFVGLYKLYKDGSMIAFSYRDSRNFQNSDNINEFLTLAERQFIILRTLENIKAVDEKYIPGYPTETLYPGEAIFNRLQKSKILHTFYPLHDEQILCKLGARWHSYRNLSLQPIDSIYSYFGGSVAMYFSFLEFFTCSLMPIAAFGIAVVLLSMDTIDKCILFSVFNMIWSTVVMELWKRHSSVLSYTWGTMQMNSQFEEPRVDYKGSMGINPITHRYQPYYPAWRRKLKIWCVSVPVLCLFLSFSLFGMYVFFRMEALVKTYYSGCWACALYLPSILHTLYVTGMNSLYKMVAEVLTEWENHRLESSYQNHLTIKVLVFRFVNCFAALFYISLYLQDLELLRKKLASLLVLTQIINQLIETLVPYLYKTIMRKGAGLKKMTMENTPDIDKIKLQGEMSSFPGMFDEYMELFVQFGYVSLFSCIYPLTAILVMVNNITEIRMDAMKLCHLFRKPFISPAANIGVWQTAFEMIGFLSVISNCFLISISPQVEGYCAENNITPKNVLIWTVGIEHALLAIKIILAFAIPDVPQWVKLRIERVEYQSLQALKHKLAEADKDDSREMAVKETLSDGTTGFNSAESTLYTSNKQLNLL
ncbi:anoctamin-10 isoform X1 [Chiloscyllium plagiosum]|uniref:anoctamin-10 isoform X1 n=1 Tax=Chiloscyllium plagiosum TaxID=36176 RepID=UPI001CB80F62|nr:anoctamin-10 isoform X1 [Chiloscyllium plagiosum]XP_043563106.1 anoctamin-10 isoform X1 [Chiloscyllium plagiosum]XP_043563108.1 anoctamin-10 isoform X1 [Chiloscyllium plagiosum]